MESDRGEVTQLLLRWRAGDAEAEARLFELLLPDLVRLPNAAFEGSPPETLFSQLHWSMKLSFAWQNPRPSIGRTGVISLQISARVMRPFLIERARVRPDIITRKS
jgi:hypothetical protein